MKYMLLIYADPAAAPAQGSAEAQDEFGHWGAVTQEMTEAGVIVAGDALQPSDTATTVRVREGERLLTDGPFAETKEVLLGFYLLDVPNLDQALEWAAKLPNAPYGSVEVRAVPDFGA